ncbi:hypothetical protein MICRO11B_60015 [Micrococcus luteus]|nr:hypothetical protein MICRO11B_60015 [Micrococcus luteus]
MGADAEGLLRPRGRPARVRPPLRVRPAPRAQRVPDRLSRRQDAWAGPDGSAHVRRT